MRLIERKVMSYECILFLIFKMKCCILYSFAVVVWRNVDADVVPPHGGVSWEPPEPDGHACLTACLHVSLFCRRKYGDWGEVPHSFLWLYHVFILTLYFGAEFSYESCLECDASLLSSSLLFHSQSTRLQSMSRPRNCRWSSSFSELSASHL